MTVGLQEEVCSLHLTDGANTTDNDDGSNWCATETGRTNNYYTREYGAPLGRADCGTAR
jgi:hypothetical protein